MDTRTGKVFEINEDNTFVLTNPYYAKPPENGIGIINEKNCIHLCKHCAERNCDKRSRHTRAICKDFDPVNGELKYRAKFGSTIK